MENTELSATDTKEADAICFLERKGYKVVPNPQFIDPNILYLIRSTNPSDGKEVFRTRRTEKGKGQPGSGGRIARVELDKLTWKPLVEVHTMTNDKPLYQG